MKPINVGSVVTLQRDHEDKYGTRGRLLYNGQLLCHTLEEPWRNNERKVSCIPPDKVYDCRTHNGAHFTEVWEVTKVPDRTAILIHSGNTLRDTEGCILVGMSKTAIGVAQSRDALTWLRTVLPPQFRLHVRGIPTPDEGNSKGGL